MSQSLTTVLQQLFQRDLKRLKQELSLYRNEETIWMLSQDISNCAGNLALHLVGNLNHFIGATLGNTGYIRQRPLEFSQKDIPVATLNKMIDDTSLMIEKVLGQMTTEQLQDEFPLLVFKEKTSTQFMLVHLTTHLSYHLGQVNYHRRLLSKTQS